MVQNRSQEILSELGLINPKEIVPYFPRVRDRDDVAALTDQSSGLIFLNRTDHMDAAHYETMDVGSYWGAPSRAEALLKYREDDERRAAQFKTSIEGKDFIDIGCGTGGLLDLVKPFAKTVAGVELQSGVRGELEKLGYRMYRTSGDIPDASCDVISLFHTLEHLPEPIEALREAYRALRSGATLLVEVPHARDALLALEAFRKFTLWSEHLILHTRASLQKFLETAGFSSIIISGFQRYPLANHLGWLVTEGPGGQVKFPHLRDAALEIAYQKFLEDNDKTDTLIASARK